MYDIIIPCESPNNILGALWLGDIHDAKHFDGERLCVLEGAITYPGMTYKIPILTKQIADEQRFQISSREGFVGWTDFEHHQGVVGQLLASKDQLNKCADLITDRLSAGVKLLVHCVAGIERSPLTLAWWLVKSGKVPNLEIAYEFLKSKRSIIEDRRHWIE